MHLTSRTIISLYVILKKNQSKELAFVLHMWSVSLCQIIIISFMDIQMPCTNGMFFIMFFQPTIADILHLGWWASAAAW